MSKVVIVESPAKAKTIGKYLGTGFTVRASMGHVRDLPESGLGVDLTGGAFAPTYVVPAAKNKTISELRGAVKQAEAVYLATDPDREGEAIAWHLAEVLHLKTVTTHRVTFHEITPRAIQAAMAAPRAIDRRLVDAQQARRVLDRLVGYGISPLLWRKIKKGLSAGRVQSAALRLVVERERAIRAFVPKEYWKITATLEPQAGEPPARRPFEAELLKIKGEKAEIGDEATATRIVAALQGSTWSVQEVNERQTQRRPSPPFTTSSLQQEASRKLNLPVKTTMKLAQELYEGVDLGDGAPVGLITYMRTDSVAVAAEAQTAARGVIAARFGAPYVPPKPPFYQTKAKNAQEAHEAIRPTDPRREPEGLKGRLSPAQHRLYTLIWRRFIASQMAPALLDVTTVDIGARTPRTPPTAPPPAIFRATGTVVRFPGFLAVYREGVDEGDDGLDEKRLPVLAAGDLLTLLKLLPSQHFTQPPPRYTEASLVKALEEQGIGRPSTYAATVATIQERGYVERPEKEKSLRATELGEVVTDQLIAHFPAIVDLGFTASIEQRFDDIAGGSHAYAPVLKEFYDPFAAALKTAEGAMERVRLAAEPAGEDCPACGQPMVIRAGKFGRFMACSGFPECKTTKPIVTPTGVPCPKCGSGELVEKRSKAGRTFWGCSAWSQTGCDGVSWYKPVAKQCPKCQGYLVEVGRNRTRCLTCAGEPPRRAPAATKRAGAVRRATSASATTAAASKRASARAATADTADPPPAKRTRRAPAAVETTASPPTPRSRRVRPAPPAGEG